MTDRELCIQVATGTLCKSKLHKRFDVEYVGTKPGVILTCAETQDKIPFTDIEDFLQYVRNLADIDEYALNAEGDEYEPLGRIKRVEVYVDVVYAKPHGK